MIKVTILNDYDPAASSKLNGWSLYRIVYKCDNGGSPAAIAHGSIWIPLCYHPKHLEDALNEAAKRQEHIEELREKGVEHDPR